MRAVLLFISLFLITCSVQAQENKLIDSLNKVIQSSKNDSSRIDALNKLASRYNYNNPDTSKIISRTAYQLAKKIKYSKGIADSWHVLASSHEVQSLYDSAIFYQEKALEIRKKINDKYGVSSSLNNMGTAYYHKGNHNKAIELYIASANMDEELNDLTGVASSYNNIGLIYWGQNNLEKANEYFTLTYNIFKRLKDDFGIAGALSNLGGIAYTQKRIEASLDYFLRSLMLYEKVQKEQYIALICSNIGEVYSELKRYPEAIPYIKRAIAYQYKIGDAFGLINSQLVLAKLQSNTKNYLAAESTLKLIIQKSDEIQANTQKVTALEMLADVYAGSNNYKDGFYTFKQFWALKDTLNKIEKSNQINDVSAKYETDKKNKEIELLKKAQEISELQQESTNSQNKLIRNTLIAIVIIALVVFYMLYNRNKLKQKANEMLQQKNHDIQLQKNQIEQQAEELSEKNKEITDSIRYAKRIQMAILPSPEAIKRILTDSFIFYKPKDIVSGDFYWVEEINGKSVVAAVDCTGHGVPGALMSVVGSSTLNQICAELKNPSPDKILNELNKAISTNLLQKNSETGIRDGMDIALCMIDFKKSELQFAGAVNSAYIVRNNTVTDVPADKIYIGTWHENPDATYRCQTIALEKGDMVYLFTDGYPDQFGGPKGKKFKYRQLIETLKNIANLPCEFQKEELSKVFDNWRGNLEQVDDVCVIGVRI